jgi:hypothetical protein
LGEWRQRVEEPADVGVTRGPGGKAVHRRLDRLGEIGEQRRGDDADQFDDA